MKTSVFLVLGLALLATGVTAVSCGGPGTSGPGGNETNGAGGGGGNGGGGAKCSSTDFEVQVIAFCKTQHPPAPKPGTMGAGCTDDSQCSSGLCLEPFGGAAHCSIQCPAGNECPVDFNCSDSGTGLGPVCYQGVCIYGGSDLADCTTNLLDELGRACESDCKLSRTEAWIDCLASAGRLCGTESAAEVCGAERGLLEACCIGCDGNSW